MEAGRVGMRRSGRWLLPYPMSSSFYLEAESDGEKRPPGPWGGTHQDAATH
jgi:hypothetical protein